ncbi:unnamed protein product [Hyaloperonospora brassicae]|uniref:SGNH hydrolase-type esterase domain-containing protein n=1 Tax=Hyaloperonospora brassicae TaxID=162125 RepID=A0AAV0UIQ5_HYABA|nr:unnamed protein product [Hyaloperonospora brassicae]
MYIYSGLYIAIAAALSTSALSETASTCATAGDNTTTGAVSAIRRPVMYFIGDSLTARGTNPGNRGWIALMQNRYVKSADVVSRGLSGYNTQWFIDTALPTIEKEVKDLRSNSLITLWLGTNDAALPTRSHARQHVPLAAYKKNLIKIVRTLQTAAPDAEILLITPSYVDEATLKSRSSKGLPERTNEAAGKYARACVDAGKELGTHVLDLYSFFQTLPEAERPENLSDGLHLSRRGNHIVYEQLRSKIIKAFPDFAKQLDVSQFPPFSAFTDA